MSTMYMRIKQRTPLMQKDLDDVCWTGFKGEVCCYATIEMTAEMACTQYQQTQGSRLNEGKRMGTLIRPL